jgi:hypothetical protein
MGLPKVNIITWQKNGIEFYYPKQVIQQIYGSSDDIVIEGDLVKLNGLEYNKNELADMVVDRLTSKTELPDEFCEEFMRRIEVFLN